MSNNLDLTDDTGFESIKTTNFGGVSYKDLIENFKNGHRAFVCAKHGTHDDWALTKQKSGYEYIRCKPCYRDAAEHFALHHPLYVIFNYARTHARKNKTPFTIQLSDVNDVYHQQKRKCRYTGVQFNKSNYRPSLDQIVPQKGYVATNIQLVLYEINLMKSNFCEQVFLKFCNLVAAPKNASSKRASLPLIMDMKRQPDRAAVKLKYEGFLDSGVSFCEVHGLHNRWYCEHDRQLIKCGECQLDYHREKDGVSATARKSARLAEREQKRELNEKNKKRFKAAKACECPVHGFHHNFRNMKTKTSAGAIKETIRCLLCGKAKAKSDRDKNPLNSSFTVAKYRARKIGRSFTISFNDVVETYKRQGGRCSLSGVIFDNDKKRPSIDRVDSELGYDGNNIRLILYPLNRMKSDLNSELFNKLCSLVSKNQKKRH